MIVTLAGSAVRNGVGFFFHRDVDLSLGDQRARDRGSQQVRAFIDRVGAQHRKDVILDELFAQIADHDFARAGLNRFALDRLEILALAQVGAEGDHFAAVLLFQPAQNHRGIQSARVRQYDFVDFHRCCSNPLSLPSR